MNDASEPNLNINTRIRAARRMDAAPLSRFARDSFVATFGHIYPLNDLETFIGATYSEEIQGYEITEATRRTWIAEAGASGIVGYIHIGPMSLPLRLPEGRRAGEIKRLYVSEVVKGRGVAHDLMRTALTWMKGDGVEDAYLGVWAENARARAFYAGYGFEIAGSYQFAVGNTLDDERILKLSLR
jgi:diamine N-acetyltransferase